MEPEQSEAAQSTHLGVFIGDLVSPPAAAGDLLNHQLSVRRREMQQDDQNNPKTVSFPALLRRQWPHLLSRLWSSSPSRQAVSPTNRTVSTTPSASLRLDRVASPSSDDFSSMVLWGSKRGRAHSSFVLAVRGFHVRKECFLTWVRTQLRCTT